MARPDVSDERVPQILKAATQVFSQFGIDGASMSQIAEVCQLSKATMYHYFDSEDALVIALVKQLFEDDQKNLDSIVTDSSSSLSRLEAYPQKLVILLERNQHLSPIFAEFHALAMREKGIQAVIRAYYEHFLQVFETVIKQGVDDGELRHDLDANQTAMAYIAIIEGSILIAQNLGQSIDGFMMVSVAVFLKILKN
jgi:AcrR family transcriptional regulator